MRVTNRRMSASVNASPHRYLCLLRISSHRSIASYSFSTAYMDYMPTKKKRNSRVNTITSQGNGERHQFNENEAIIMQISRHLDEARTDYFAITSSYGPCFLANPHLYTPLFIPSYTHSLTSSIWARRCAGYKSKAAFLAIPLNSVFSIRIISPLSLLTIVLFFLSHKTCHESKPISRPGITKPEAYINRIMFLQELCTSRNSLNWRARRAL